MSLNQTKPNKKKHVRSEVINSAYCKPFHIITFLSRKRQQASFSEVVEGISHLIWWLWSVLIRNLLFFCNVKSWSRTEIYQMLTYWLSEWPHWLQSPLWLAPCSPGEGCNGGVQGWQSWSNRWTCFHWDWLSSLHGLHQIQRPAGKHTKQLESLKYSEIKKRPFWNPSAFLKANMTGWKMEVWFYK